MTTPPRAANTAPSRSATASAEVTGSGLPWLQVDVPGERAVPFAAVIGCPVPQGMLSEGQRLKVTGPEGDAVVHTRPLKRWPDGSVAWSLLTFAAPGRGVHQLALDEATSDASPAAAATWLREQGDELVVGNDRLQVTLARTGAGPVRKVTLDGRPIVESEADLQFTVGKASSLHGEVERVEVVEQTAGRVWVRVHGDHRTSSGETRLHYHLDVALWAGLTSLRLDYQFVNLTAGVPEVTVPSMSCVVRPSVGGDTRHHLFQPHYDLPMIPRRVTTRKSVAVIADWARRQPRVADISMFDDDLDYPAYLRIPAEDASDWVGLAGPEGGVYLRLKDMAQMRPKRLRAESGALAADLWPAEAGPLQVPQGRARRHTMVLAFTAGDARPEDDEAAPQLLNAPLHEGRVVISPDWFRQLGVFDQDRMLEPRRHARMETYLYELMELDLGTGLFNHGDGVEAHYSRGQIGAGRNPLRPGMKPSENPFRADCPDAHPRSQDRYEPVWANNEYDVIHALAAEIMRTGRRDLWARLHATARHNIEVDFVYYSDDEWQHHGSPTHSANHNLSSAYPSHMWTQGLIEYHCLTGDKDALEVAIKLGHTIIRNLEDEQRRKAFWGFNREIGWALLSLVQLYEMLPADEGKVFGDYAAGIVDYLTQHDLEGQRTPVKLSSVDAMDDIYRQIASAFFGYASMVEAIDRYARLTGREDVQAWLRNLLTNVRKAAVSLTYDGRLLEPLRRMVPHGMAVGYELTGDPAFLKVGLVCLEMFMGTIGWVVPTREVKETAMVYRSLTRFAKHACDTGLLDRFEFDFGSETPE